MVLRRSWGGAFSYERGTPVGGLVTCWPSPTLSEPWCMMRYLGTTLSSTWSALTYQPFASRRGNIPNVQKRFAGYPFQQSSVENPMPSPLSLSPACTSYPHPSPMSSEYGTCKTLKARFWHWLSGESR